jgi:hypothetical protein
MAGATGAIAILQTANKNKHKKKKKKPNHAHTKAACTS